MTALSVAESQHFLPRQAVREPSCVVARTGAAVVRAAHCEVGQVAGETTGYGARIARRSLHNQFQWRSLSVPNPIPHHHTHHRRLSRSRRYRDILMSRLATLLKRPRVSPR